MQIHELNNFTGTLGSGAYLAVDDGNDTGKLSTQQLLSATEARIDNIIASPTSSAEEVVDARLGADGVTYTSLGKAVRDQFTDVKSDFNDIATTIPSKNLFNKDKVTDGYYINASTGQPVANASYCYSDKIPVTAGESIALTDVNHVVFFSNADSVTGSLVLSSVTGVVPSGTTYMRASIMTAYVGSAQIEYGTTRTAYESYGDEHTIKSSALLPQNKGVFDIIVDKNGNGNYTTVTEAVQNANSGDRIYIRNGNYPNEVIEAWGKDLTIIGESKEGVMIYNALDDYDTPPLEMCSGHLENVTLWAIYNGQSGEKHAYALHCEHGNMVDKSFVIKNCAFLSANNYALGMGLRKGCKVNIVECDFLNGAGGLFFHDAYQSQYAGTMQFSMRRCRLSSSEAGRVPLRIQSQALDGNTVVVEFIGNTLYNSNNPSMPVNYYNDGDITGEGWNGLINFVGSKQNFGNQASVLNN